MNEQLQFDEIHFRIEVQFELKIKSIIHQIVYELMLIEGLLRQNT